MSKYLPTHYKHPLYSIWKSMRQRCNNPYSKDYESYGGRGIIICEEWNNFQQFISDMGERPSRKHYLDRINNDGNYSKDNCRWATSTESLANRRKYKKEKYIYFEGLRKTVREWIKFLGINKENAVLTRIYNNNWSFVEAVTTPVKVSKRRIKKK